MFHPLLQLRVLRFGFLQDGDVGVGVFPKGEDSVGFMALLTYFYERFLYDDQTYRPRKYGCCMALALVRCFVSLSRISFWPEASQMP
jgi:hypothetical protein